MNALHQIFVGQTNSVPILQDHTDVHVKVDILKEMETVKVISYFPNPKPTKEPINWRYIYIYNPILTPS